MSRGRLRIWLARRLLVWRSVLRRERMIARATHRDLTCELGHLLGMIVKVRD